MLIASRAHCFYLWEVLPYFEMLWGGGGVQYKPQDPSYHIRNASNIQTLGIIAGKKKPPVTGAKFIVGCVVYAEAIELCRAKPGFTKQVRRVFRPVSSVAVMFITVNSEPPSPRSNTSLSRVISVIPWIESLFISATPNQQGSQLRSRPRMRHKPRSNHF